MTMKKEKSWCVEEQQKGDHGGRQMEGKYKAISEREADVAQDVALGCYSKCVIIV